MHSFVYQISFISWFDHNTPRELYTHTLFVMSFLLYLSATEFLALWMLHIKGPIRINMLCLFNTLLIFFYFLGGWGGGGLWPFQEYFTYIEPIVNQKWEETGVPGEKPPDLPVQNLASDILLIWRSTKILFNFANIYERMHCQSVNRPIIKRLVLQNISLISSRSLIRSGGNRNTRRKTTWPTGAELGIWHSTYLKVH